MMELNDSKPEEKPSRAMPFEIDLNEPPLSSPRQTLPVAAELAPAPPRLGTERAEGRRIRAALLDINAEPPSEGDGDETAETMDSGMHVLRDTSFIGNSLNAPVTCSNLLYVGNEFDLLKTSGSVRHIVRTDFKDSVQQRLNFSGNFTETDLSSKLKGRPWASDTTTCKMQLQNPSEVYMQELREFIAENHGILGDGWHVEFNYCQDRSKIFPIYCAPDGNRFGSIFDVACHLGLVLDCHSVEPEGTSDRFAFLQKRLHLCGRREPFMYSRAKNFKGCQENLRSYGGEFSLGIETGDTQVCKLKHNSRAPQATSEDNRDYGALQLMDGLPIQFEDFCILSIGEIDSRSSYHNTSQIWPIGYRSSWHDRITGSLFVSDVADGGDSGPVFKVQRFPCSTQPMPVGSTVISRPSSGPYNAEGKLENDDSNAFGIIDDEDAYIQMIVSDHSPPCLDSDMLSGSGNNSNEVCNFQTLNSFRTDSNCLPQSPRNHTVDNSVLGDNIGEFLVEGSSSFSVWRMVSQTLVDACRKSYKQTGLCKFCCKDANHGMWSSCLLPESTEISDSLAKFCCLSGPIDVPCCIQSDNELITTCEALVKWLDQDRFGLDVEFVQELIEQLPAVHTCSKYKFLNERCHNSTSQTVGNGFLLVKRKTDIQDGKEADGLFKGCKRSRNQVIENSTMKDCSPPGKPVSLKLPADSIGDVLQSWELLWRFSEVLGLEEPLSFKELEGELVNGYSFILRKALTKVHSSLLKVLLGELQSKVAASVDPNSDAGESKFRRGRKKDADNLISVKKTMFDMLPVNELTWLELARRYVLTVSCMDGNLDSAEIIGRESCKVFQCLRGVTGEEADALLLAEATKQIFGSVEFVNDGLSVEHNNSDASGGYKMPKVNDSEIPEWAQALEPVRKLPTNVGARIRNCVYKALEKDPPEWAKKILEHSICKEVYKGNASGPTKKAVVSLLVEVCGENLQQKPNKKRKIKCVNAASDVIMKQCRNVLRRAAAADEKKILCSLLGGSLNISDSDDERLLGSPSKSCPLDFRTIDLRLTSGAYGGSHDTFLEDVREVWRNIRTACGNQADLINLTETLSQKFEVLYEKEVLNFVQKFMDNENGGCLSAEAKKEKEDIIESAREIPKTPLHEGVCKLCGVDKDDNNVMLCDMCDSEYHTYCLNPPLAKIPEGNWYCPSCVAGHSVSQGASQGTEVISRCRKKRCQRELNHRFLEALTQLATTMEMKEYWEYSVEERIFLLKFLCDEVLNSAKIREHLEQCASVSADLQQKLHSLSSDWRKLKVREDILAAKVAKVNTSMLNGIGKSVAEGVAIMCTNYDKLMEQPLNRSSCMSPFSTKLIPLEDGLGWPVPNDSSKQPYRFHSKSSSGKHFTNSGNQIVKTHHVVCQMNQQYIRNGLISEKPSSHVLPAFARDLYSRQNMLPLSIPKQHKNETGGENFVWSNSEREQELEKGCNDGSMLSNCGILQGHISSNFIRTHNAEHAHAMHMNSGDLIPSYHSIIQPSVNESLVHNLEASYLKNDIAVLLDSIACLESKILKVSLRKDFLGRDSAGRLYWAFSRPGTSPWVVVDGTMKVQPKEIVEEQGTPLADSSTLSYTSPFGTRNILHCEGLNVSSPYVCNHNDGTSISSSWVSFQSVTEIEELIGWVRDTFPRERELLDSILQWQEIGSKNSNKVINYVQDESQPTLSRLVNSEEVVNSNCLVTKALIVLEKKFGTCLESESTDFPMKQGQKAEVTCLERMFRCDCLELVWPSRYHCNSCHQSFSTSEELKRHNNGVCYSSKVIDNALKGKAMIRTEVSLGECSNEKEMGSVSGSVMHDTELELNKFPKELACPFDIEEISTKFITKDSNKELVQGIGLIGSNGIPSFVPNISPYLDDPTLKLLPSWKNEGNQGGGSMNVENQLQQSVERKMKNSTRHGSFSINSTRRFAKNGVYEEALKFERAMNKRGQSSFGKYKTSDLRVGNYSVIRDSSLRPIFGRGFQILRQLKMILLDMDAALPEEARKPSRAGLDKRCAWCAFVKSAKSIFEMVQATIVLEDMIKTEHLRNGWWYWSSLSAAAKIATISSLALRIYTLDAAIVYEKPLSISSSMEIQKLGCDSDVNNLTCSNPTNTPKTSSKPVKLTHSLDLTEDSNPSSKPSKKRKGSGE